MASEASAELEPAVERDRVQPAREVAQLLAGQRDLLARQLEHPVGLGGIGGGLAARHVDVLAERDEPLLGAVVQVAPDAAALLVGRLHDPPALGGQLGLALAQDRLLPAPLDLGRGARGEDPQHGHLVLGRVEPLARHHADVADLRRVGADSATAM